MTVFAVASCKCRNQRMVEARKEAPALAAIICVILAKHFRHSVARRRGHKLDAKVACHPRTEGIPSGSPLRRRFSGLLKSSGQSGFRKRIRAKRIEFKEP